MYGTTTKPDEVNDIINLMKRGILGPDQGRSPSRPPKNEFLKVDGKEVF